MDSPIFCPPPVQSWQEVASEKWKRLAETLRVQAAFPGGADLFSGFLSLVQGNILGQDVFHEGHTIRYQNSYLMFTANLLNLQYPL